MQKLKQKDIFKQIVKSQLKILMLGQISSRCSFLEAMNGSWLDSGRDKILGSLLNLLSFHYTEQTIAT